MHVKFAQRLLNTFLHIIISVLLLEIARCGPSTVIVLALALVGGYASANIVLKNQSSLAQSDLLDKIIVRCRWLITSIVIILYVCVFMIARYAHDGAVVIVLGTAMGFGVANAKGINVNKLVNQAKVMNESKLVAKLRAVKTRFVPGHSVGQLPPADKKG